MVAAIEGWIKEMPPKPGISSLVNVKKFADVLAFTVRADQLIDMYEKNEPDLKTPQKSLNGVKIFHWTGGWYVGSSESEKGVLLKNNITWQFYQDHADHE